MSVHLISHTFTISKTSSSKSMYTVSRKRIFDTNEFFCECFFSKLRDKIPVVLNLQREIPPDNWADGYVGNFVILRESGTKKNLVVESRVQEYFVNGIWTLSFEVQNTLQGIVKPTNG